MEVSFMSASKVLLPTNSTIPSIHRKLIKYNVYSNTTARGGVAKPSSSVLPDPTPVQQTTHTQTQTPNDTSLTIPTPHTTTVMHQWWSN
ncbi:hypothetical protein EON63_20685 [archaeon]|nr:MAG: hypothetical protein EON63_20685 [archaeon]